MARTKDKWQYMANLLHLRYVNSLQVGDSFTYTSASGGPRATRYLTATVGKMLNGKIRVNRNGRTPLYITFNRVRGTDTSATIQNLGVVPQNMTYKAIDNLVASL